MRIRSYILFLFILVMTGCFQAQKANKTTTPVLKDSIVKIQMNLSAFTVESGTIPSINILIDFLQDTSMAVKTYYNPAYKDSRYTLTETEMQSILKLLKFKK